jgi:TolB-like protein/class 3 adenylate cyclase
MSEGIQRRLSAILAADVVGYSRLMGEDEAGTLNALRQLRTELLAPKVSGHRGKVVKSMGDGWLVEFASVADAVTCAIEMQEGLAGNENIKLRVSVHLGDITHEDDDIYGDGVNIAARLQEIAEPGGIVISDIARRSIDGKLAAAFVDLGAQDLKNIAEAIIAYGWGVTALVGASTALPLPDKPSIAVLPFENMSGDPEQEYFVDGLTEDIITILSKVSGLLVISRNSTFLYKGQAIDVGKVAKELNVRYVVEGSVRKSGDRVRITAQLIDGTSDHHVWAERYDRRLDDVFELQDEMTREIVTSLEVKLSEGEQVRVWRRQAGDFSAYEHFARGRERVMDFSRESNAQAIVELQTALDINPNFGVAYAFLGWVETSNARFGWSDNRDEALERAREYAEQAIANADDPGIGYALLGSVNFYQGKFEDAVAAAKQAVNISPSNADCYQIFAMASIAVGNWNEAVHAAESALRLNPLIPENSLVELARAQFHLERFKECYESAVQVIERKPAWLTARVLAAAAAASLGRTDDSKVQISEILRKNPKFSVSKWARYQTYENDSDLQVYVSGLLNAGLPQ